MCVCVCVCVCVWVFMYTHMDIHTYVHMFLYLIALLIMLKMRVVYFYFYLFFWHFNFPSSYFALKNKLAFHNDFKQKSLFPLFNLTIEAFHLWFFRSSHINISPGSLLLPLVWLCFWWERWKQYKSPSCGEISGELSLKLKRSAVQNETRGSNQ